MNIKKKSTLVSLQKKGKPLKMRKIVNWRGKKQTRLDQDREKKTCIKIY